MTDRTSLRRRLGALAGMAGPALFMASFTIEGWLRPGYSARSMYISALSLGPRGGIQICNFIVMGVLFLAFAWGVAASFREGKASRAGPILLTIIGVSFLVSGPLVMDPANTPPDHMTPHGIAHGIFGALVFSLAPVTCIVFLRRFRQEAEWRWLRAPTLVATVVIITAILVLKAGPARPPAPPNVFNDWSGFIQRAALMPYLVWVMAFAVGLWRKERVASSR